MTRRDAATFEEHGEVLAHWLASDMPEDLVIFDRHLDFKFIGDDAMARLRFAANDPEAAARLNRALPFQRSAEYAYGLDDFLFAAGALGLVQRATWVYPTDMLSSAVGAWPLWQRLQLVPRVGWDVLDSYEMRAGHERAFVGVMELCAAKAEIALQHAAGREVHVDVDVDFCCTPAGKVMHSPDECADMIRTFAPVAAPTFTYSISSGFTPPTFRLAAERLFERLELRARPSGTTPRPVRQSVLALVSAKPLRSDEIAALWISELAELGAAGHVAHALLAAQSGDELAAEDSWGRARDAGDRASWPAYTLALRALQRGDTLRAVCWLERLTAGAVEDSLEGHALLLLAVCLLELGRLDEAVQASARCIFETPMQVDAHDLLAMALDGLGRSKQAAQARAFGADVAALRGGRIPRLRTNSREALELISALHTQVAHPRSEAQSHAQ